MSDLGCCGLEHHSRVNKARVIMSSTTSAVTYASVYTDSDEEPMRRRLQLPGPRVTTDTPIPPDEVEHEFLGMRISHYPVDSLLTEDGPRLTILWFGGDDGDDDDGDSSRDDANDEDEDDEVVKGGGGSGEGPRGGPVYHHLNDITIGARITVRPQTSISLPPEAETLRIASTQTLIDAVTAALPSPSLPPLPPSLYIPPPVDHRDDIPESEQPPRKRLYLSTIGSRYEIGESSTARPTRGRGVDYGFVSTVDAEERRQGIRDVGYGIRDTWEDPAEAVPEIAPITMGEVNPRVTELAELHEHDTQDLFALLEDA
ncbi:hypothetical protein Tco_1035259 [Tanacetum coccineum]